MEYVIRATKLISRNLLGEARDHHPLAVVWGSDVKPSFITWMKGPADVRISERTSTLGHINLNSLRVHQE